MNVYIKPPYTTATANTKYLIQRNFVVNRETYFELDLGDYDYIFTQSGHYTFLVTDAVTNDDDLASGRSTNSNFINFVKTSDSVPDTGCTDSDDGYDIYEAGQANGREIGTSDACIGNTLREAVCKNGQATHVEVACPSSAPYCNKGACSASRPKCQDTDGGINPSVKGTVTEARTADGPKHTDYCQDATTKSFMESCSGSNCGLREYYCPSTYTNTMAYNDVKCPNGCRDGVCYGYEDNEIPEVEDDCHLSSLSQFELNEDNVLSFYTVNPQESTIDFGGNHQYGIAQETKVQVVKDPTTDSSFVIRMNRYETSAQANRMFDIINTQHTRQVLFHDTRLGDETFCHVSPDFDDRNPGRYYYICGFRKGNVYADVQATITTDSQQKAIDIMEVVYDKVSQSSCAAQVPPTVVYAPEESHSMIGKIINGNKNTYSLGGEDYEIEAYLDPTGTEAKFIVEGEATGGLVSMESDPAGHYYHKFSFGAKIAALVFDNNVIKFQFVVGEGEFEEGADVYYSDAEEAVEIIQVVTPSVRPIERAGDCEGQGCLADHSCLSFGIRMMSGSTPAFCDIDGNFKIQKADEKSCQNNYECLSNACASGKCVDFESRLGSLEQEVKETKGILNSLFEWLSRIFGGR